MSAETAKQNARRIADLVSAGRLTEEDTLHRLSQILLARSPTSPNPEGSARIYLRDIRNLAQEGQVPLHLGRFLQSPQVMEWMKELAPAHDALLTEKAGHDAAAAARLPVPAGAAAPTTARFQRKGKPLAP